MSDRSLAHPIELARDLAELTRALDRLATGLERENSVLTEEVALLRGQIVNKVLWMGAAKLEATPAGYIWTKSFQAPFASVRVDDANSIGPLLVVNDQGASATVETQGTGRYKVPAGALRTFAMTGTELTVCSLAEEPSGGFVYVTVFTTVTTEGNA